MAIDFSKAFDTVPHIQLLSQILASSLSPDIICRLSCYLKGRTARCSFNGTLSAFRSVHAGVPQRSVISPALFNHFVVRLSPHSPPHHLITCVWRTTSRQQHLLWTSLLLQPPSLPTLPMLRHGDIGRAWQSPSSNHTLLSPYPPVPNRPTRHLGGIQPRTVSNPKNPGGHLRPPLHLLTTHRRSLRAPTIQTEHSEVLSWHLLGPAKGNYPHHFQITHQVLIYVCHPHLVPQLMPLIHSQTIGSIELR